MNAINLIETFCLTKLLTGIPSGITVQRSFVYYVGLRKSKSIHIVIITAYKHKI